MIRTACLPFQSSHYVGRAVEYNTVLREYIAAALWLLNLPAPVVCQGHRLVTQHGERGMGYKYQNKLGEENERLYWSRFPRWYRRLARIAGWIMMSIFAVLAIYGSFGWIVLKFL